MPHSASCWKQEKASWIVEPELLNRSQLNPRQQCPVPLPFFPGEFNHIPITIRQMINGATALKFLAVPEKEFTGAQKDQSLII